MAITMTDALVRAILDSGYDAVFNNGKIQLRSGAAPGAGAAPTGTLLGEEVLPADAFAAAAARAKGKNGVWSDVGLAAGNVGHYRMIAVGDTAAATQNEPRQEGTVSAIGGGGDVTLDNVNIAVGQVFTINTFSVSIP